MGEEIVLEVIDHRNSLLEEFFCTAAVHEDGLCTKHLRHFRQNGCTTLCHEPVTEFTYEGIGGDTRETIRTATLQSDA